MIYKVNKKTITQSNEEECLEYIDTLASVGLDIETTKKYGGQVYGDNEGLDPYTSRIIMIQVGDEETQFVIDARRFEPTTILEKVNTKEIVGHNLKFEFKHIYHNYGIRLKNFYDTMIIECVLEAGNPRARYSLKYVTEKYLGSDTSDDMDKSIRMGFLTLQDEDFSEDQILYGAMDIIAPMRILEGQKRRLRFLGLNKVYEELEKPFICTLGYMEYQGVYLDKELWLDLYRANLERFYNLEQELNSYIEKDYQRFAPFLNEGKSNILWTSSKQVIPVMQMVGVDTWVKDKIKTKQTGVAHYKHSVEAKHLRKYSTHILVRTYIKYKTAQKYVTSYGEKFLEHINPITGRIHPDYWQIVTTGRLSCKNPNLQNITNGEFRNCFIAPQSKDLICVDFSQQEPRITANYCKDASLMKLFLEGDGDTHSLVAAKVFEAIEKQPQHIDKHNEGWSEKFNMSKRKVGKTINLGLDYGKSAYSMKDDLGITAEEAEEIYNAVLKAFPGKQKYFDEKIKDTYKKGYILADKVLGRKIFMDYYLSKYKIALKKSRSKEGDKENVSTLKSLEGTIQRNAQNYPTQSTAASMTKKALNLIYKWQEKNNAWKMFSIINTVHDEIIAESCEEHSQQAAAVIEWAMVKAGKIFCEIIPMIAEPKTSKVWSH